MVEARIIKSGVTLWDSKFLASFSGVTFWCHSLVSLSWDREWHLWKRLGFIQKITLPGLYIYTIYIYTAASLLHELLSISVCIIFTSKQIPHRLWLNLKYKNICIYIHKHNKILRDCEQIWNNRNSNFYFKQKIIFYRLWTNLKDITFIFTNNTKFSEIVNKS